MPDPFRHYFGTPLIDLPADAPPPGASSSAPDGASFLSALLFHSAAISASKLVPSTGARYALRVNPSSGNLHPTEFHFVTRGLTGWTDGLYHYRPSSHMAEQRALGTFDLPGVGDSPVVFILTSIAWREAWKYRARAYRYCLHDIGHAWQSLSLAAQAMGCESFAIGQFGDDPLAKFGRLSDDEWPMLILCLDGASIPVSSSVSQEQVWFGGRANQLSAETIAYALIDEIHAATKVIVPAAPARRTGVTAVTASSFAETARKRRSALDFTGGADSMSLAQLSTILAEATRPLSADFAASSFIQLYLYVHRVDGLGPGVYRFQQDTGELELIKSSDQRVVAAALSLGQNLAGNACVAFSMIGDLNRATRTFGDRGYRYVHFEAGAIGQRLYLAAEAQGLGATGIGAFFDDQVHRYLNLAPEDGRVVYHFAIGYPVPDPRLSA
jgi:SagB-type dehydrogenase family enzyme